MSLGYAAEAFSSGGAFLKSDRVRDTACLLTDVQMPGVNGLELQRRLTEQGYPLPILHHGTRRRKSPRGSAGGRSAWFLAKPFNDEELVACALTPRLRVARSS